MPTPQDYAGLPAVSAPAFSCDGRTLFHLGGAGLPQLCALELASGQLRVLTAHDEKVGSLRRAPNDDGLAYTVDAGGDERHQLWRYRDNIQSALTAAPAVVHGLGPWSPDGSQLALTANSRDEAHFDAVLLDATSGAMTHLLDGVNEAKLAAWSKDGPLVMVQERSTEDMRLLILQDGAATPVPSPGPTRYASLRWDGAALLGLTAHGDFTALCRIDPATGAITPEYAPPGREVEAYALSSAGLLATVENDRGYAVLRVGSREGERPVVDLPPGIVTDLAWSPDGTRLAFTGSTSTDPAALFLWQEGTVQTVLPTPCDLPVRPFDLVEWTGPDGTPIQGWFARPDREPPYPAIVWVHGGPASQARPGFRPDMQSLLAQGYAVLMPNVRGSTGYGRAFMRADDREKRLDATADLAAGRAWLVRQPGIDPARIAVMGQSYGGYMVLSAITEHPDLWRCAIDLYGVSDFTTLLAATGPWRRGHRAAEYGDPVRHRALFDRISPLHRIDRVQVPLLVLHGTRDPRVPFGESEQVVDALRLRQHHVRFEVFDYAGHGFVRPDDKRRLFTAVAEFLAEHL